MTRDADTCDMFTIHLFTAEQIAKEAPANDAAWIVQCRCGWAAFARCKRDCESKARDHVTAARPVKL